MKLWKRWMALGLCACLVAGVAQAFVPVREAQAAVLYQGALIKSTGSNQAEAVIRGTEALIVTDAQTKSDVLQLNGGGFAEGYLELPKDLLAGATEGFSVVMDVKVSEDAKPYQRLFQSTSILPGTGDTGWWDAPDISVDLCDFSKFRTTVFVGDSTHTADDGKHRASAQWGSGAAKGSWNRLALVVTKTGVKAYYAGTEYDLGISADVTANLFAGELLKTYTYNTLGHSVYGTDEDIRASYDNVAVYTRGLTKEEATGKNLPTDYTYFWDFEKNHVTLSEMTEAVDALDVYTDGTKLSKEAELTSPDGKTATMILSDKATGRFFYSVTRNGEAVLHASMLGLTTEQVDFTKGLTLDAAEVKTAEGKDSYTLMAGGNRKVEDSYREITLPFTKDGSTMTVTLRAYNDGVAYRYQISENGKTSGKITGEASEFVLPEESVFWCGEPSDTYEGGYSKKTMASMTAMAQQMSTPLLASVASDKYFVLMTEAAVFSSENPYCASIFETGSQSKNIRFVFGRKQAGAVSVNYPFATPWRVAIIGETVGAMAESTLVTSLNPAADEDKDWSFVKPGKSAWSWWSSTYDAIEPQTQKDYIDFAAENGWEYVLVDYGWELWKDYKKQVEDIVSYGASKGVGILLWYGVDKFDGKHIFDLNNRATIDAQFAWCQEIGVAGVKIDYLNSDNQKAMDIMYQLADSAAEHELMIVFHGCTNPNGENRTYPNIVSYEAVRGAEYYKWNIGADINSLLTYLFTRNVLGSMDFTPTAYPLTALDVTAGFAAAQTIVYESGIQHFAHSAYVYEGTKVLSLLNTLPTVWDESLLSGYPGKYNMAVRRNGEDWYLGAMTDKERTLTVTLDFLADGETYQAVFYEDDADGKELAVSVKTVKGGDTLTISLKNHGGAAVRFTKDDVTTETSYEKNFTYYEAEDAKVNGSCKIEENQYASGLSFVGWIGNGAANDVVFETVTAETEGWYDMKIFFASGENRNLSVSVNDGEPIELKNLLSYSNDWSAVGCHTVRIPLKKGENVIRFYNESGYAPSIDRIAIGKTAGDAEKTPTTDGAQDETTAHAQDETTVQSSENESPMTGQTTMMWLALIVLAASAMGIFLAFGKAKKVEEN